MTIFLAQIIGLYVLIVGLSMLFFKKRWLQFIDDTTKPQSQTLNYVLAIVAVPVGLLLVLLNNIWDAGLLPLVVTLFAWLILLKSIMVFVLAPEQLGGLVKTIKMKNWWYVYVVIVLIIGVYLTYAGFTSIG